MSYTDTELDLIFSQAAPVLGAPGVARDCDGRLICRSHYGLEGAYGWEVDHAVPKALGGLETYANLRPRHWLGNSTAGGLLGQALTLPRTPLGRVVADDQSVNVVRGFGAGMATSPLNGIHTGLSKKGIF